MAVRPWRATSIQMESQRAAQASTDGEAVVIIDRNIDRLIGLIERACASNDRPDLVVFPEFAVQGPPLGMNVPDWIARACSAIPGRLTERLQQLASREQIYIAGNMFEAPPEWPGRYFNSSLLIDRSGEIVINYRRINTAAFPSPHDFMDDYLSRTRTEDVFPVADTELGRLALIPCAEINVPEVARIFMMRGAEVILHPTNSRYTIYQEAAKISRAAENMMYLVSANVAGPIGFSPDNKLPGGRSHILNHHGETLAFQEDANESISVSAIIDIEALRRDRRADTGIDNPLLRARFEMYRPYYESAAFYPANHFLETPMRDAEETTAAVALTRARLEQAGVLHPEN